MQWVGRLRLLAGAVLWCGVSYLGTAPAAAQGGPDVPASGSQAFPRLANMYLHGAVDPADIPALARWDMLILDPVWTNDQLRQLRELNPDIKLFFYTCPYCLTVSPEPTDGWRRLNLEYVRSNDLWWRNADGTIASDWPGVWMANITEIAPAGPWGQYRRWLGARMQQLVATNTQLDGVFYDNFWKSVSWQQGRTLRLDSDCNPTHNPAGCDGRMDPPAILDSLWNRALGDFARDTRKRYDDVERSRGTRRIAVMGNGASDYFQFLNGALHEHFPSGHTPPDPGNRYGYNWNHEMFASSSGYLTAPFRTEPFNAQVLNAVWSGTWDAPARSEEFERHKRFTFVSALLGDGFYSLDAETQGHGSLWWEPEYDGGGLGPGYLGNALGPMRRIGVNTGTEFVQNGGFSTATMPWQSQALNATGTLNIDSNSYYSSPSAARIDVSDALPEGAVMLYQSVPVLGGCSYTFSFWARASRPQEIMVHLYADNCPTQRCLPDQRFRVTPAWKEYSLTFVSTANARASLNFFVAQPGSVWLDDVSLRMGLTAVYRRDFEHGIVLLNYNPSPVTIPLDGTYKRLQVPGSSVWDGGSVTSETVPPSDARILMRAVAGHDDDPSHGGMKAAARPVTRLQSETNPFRAGGGIRYQLDEEAEVSLLIYDVAGRVVRTLVQGRMPAGTEQLARWDGKDTRGAQVPAGVYFARLMTPDGALTEKLTLLK